MGEIIKFPNRGKAIRPSLRLVVQSYGYKPIIKKGNIVYLKDYKLKTEMSKLRIK